jgi:hypothetical protein
MTTDACMVAFAQAPDGDTFASYIDETSPDCACEVHQVSPHCVDAVAPNEVLVRLVMDPTHIHADAQGTRLKSSFFNVAATAGASCLRYGRASDAEYVLTAQRMLEENPTTPDGMPRKVYGVVKIEVEKVREQQITLTGNTTRAFCVYATGTAECSNHCDVVMNGIKRHNLSRSKQNRAAEKLTQQVERQIISVQDFIDTADLTRWA